MKNIYWKKIIPHAIAIVIFLAVAVIYCKPALDGKVLQQGDINQWKGMSHDASVFAEKNGHAPLWTNSMFGGMPAYQITGVGGFAYSVGLLDVLFTLKLPEPIGLFFLAALCFYFLAQVLGFNSFVSVIGALAYSFSTYNPIIVMAGHITKMHAIAYLPFFVGAILLLFQKKYTWGGVLTGIATALFFATNHLQINYYGLIIVAFITLYYLIIWIIKKDFTTLLKTLATALVAGAMGIAVCAPMLISTYEYGKETIRGGSKLAKQSTDKNANKTSGLNKEYAFSYSMYKSEPLVLMFPNVYGATSDPNIMNAEESKAIEVLQGMQPQVAQQLQSFLDFYWGGIGFTAGPAYIGVLICLFACIGLFSKNNPHKWWIAPTIIFACLLSAGGYFEGFNVFMLNHLPFYNKFRAPSMIMVIPALLLGMLSMYGLKTVVDEHSFVSFFKNNKWGIGCIGLVLTTIFLFYINADFKSDNDKQLITTIAGLDANQKAVFEAPAKDLMNAMKEDRQQLLRGDITKALIVLGFVFILIFLYFKKVFNASILLIALGIVCMIDIFQVDTKYLKSENFIEPAENESVFNETPTNIALKRDTTFYRVLDVKGGIQSAFNQGALVAYHHNTVGGYHPAKLSLYQDLIENQWYKYPNCKPTMNMLNTKYILTGNLATDTIINKEALGNVWFVKGLAYEKDATAVMNKLSSFNPKDSAIVEEADATAVSKKIGFDSSATIKLINNNHDEITYSSSSKATQFAVFSEIYYPLGWKAYIDGNEAAIIKCNYLLRGLIVPAGEHKIVFEFKPQSLKMAIIASTAASLLLWVALGMMLVLGYRKLNTI